MIAGLVLVLLFGINLQCVGGSLMSVWDELVDPFKAILVYFRLISVPFQTY